MNGRLIVGILLFGMGLVLAAFGIFSVGPSDTAVVDTANTSARLAERLNTYAVPVMAGLFLSGGALLMGLSMANWRHPRTHLEPGDAAVNPEGYHKMKHV